MATQRYISTSFWDDGFVQSLDPSEKLFYMYLLTNPLTNIAGVYKVTDKRISFDTGFNYDVIRELWRRFTDCKKAVRFNDWVIIPAWPKHQQWEKRVKIRDGIVSILQDIPDDVRAAVIASGYRFEIGLIEKTIIATKQRQTISGSTKATVMRIANNSCQICGSNDDLEVDHIVPLKNGGNSSIDNLQVLCQQCHETKHSPDTLSGHDTQSRYHTNYLDSDSDSDRDIDTDLIKTPSAAVEPLPENTLYHTIKKRFEEKQPQERFTNYAKEGKAIHELIKKAIARNPDNPDEFLEAMIQMFETLRESEKFYRGQPFLPSALNASGIWDRVLSEGMVRWEEEQQAMVFDAGDIIF